MTELARPEVFVARRQAWLGQLLAACIALSEQPDTLLHSISVTERFAGVMDVERRELIRLARSLAGEYRLADETLDRGSSITARITRPASDHLATGHQPERDQSRRGLATRVRQLLPPHAWPTRGRLASAEEAAGTAAAARDQGMVS